MDQRGGCCIARYAGGVYDMSKVDRIMRRFRPIAPKPASGSGSLSSGGTTPDNGRIQVKIGRGKRRRVSKDRDSSSVSKKNNNTRKRKSSKEKSDSGGLVSVCGGGKAVKTLALLPETPEVEESGKITAKPNQNRTLWLSFGNGGEIEAPALVSSGTVARRVVLWSWVKVECVTDTCAVGCYAYGNLGRTDEERVRSLDVDTCPGFISDGLNRVRWMNAEYRRMVVGEGAEGEVAAWVVVEDGVAIPPAGCGAFTCRVKVVTWEKQRSCKTVPCDVWRMDCGGFAWRLDTRAALSLGL